MPLPHARPGEVLLVRERILPFSFFPVTRGTRRYGLFDSLFAVSPWAVMQASVRDFIPAGPNRDEAQAFLEQAQDFYAAASTRLAANPLLFYYAFLNVAKAFIRTRGFPGSLDQAMHGLSARTAVGGVELQDSEVVVKDSGTDANIYPELIERLGLPRPVHTTTYPVPQLLPQVVVGHRLWREAARVKERFVAIEDIEIVGDTTARTLWLRVYLARGDLSRYEITRATLLSQGDLLDHREVQITDTGRDSSLLCLEQIVPLTYTGRPTDVVMDLVDQIRPRLWRIATTSPEQGYRKYYLHLTPSAETASRVAQLASLWLLTYYFGSVVRYRPHLFDNVTSHGFGPFVTEFISAQPEQMLYLLASEMRQREVAKPAII